MRIEFETLVLRVASVLSLCLAPTLRGDDSATRDSLIKVPSTGGTVSQEASNLQVQDNKGAVNFSLPLPELPSRGPLVGSLALTYNQFQGGEGTGLGVGWSWDVPSIEINDDFGTALRGRDETGRFLSHFTYQGKRLTFVRKDGDKEVYQLESDDKPLELVYFNQPQEYLLVDRFNSITSKTLNHHFEVRYPDGSKEIYSGDPGEAEGVFQGSEPFINRWPLRLRLKNIPRFGRNAYNAVEYLYQKAGERSYLKSVVFAGGASRYEFDFYDKDLEQLTTTIEDPETGEVIDKSLGALFPGKTSSLKSYEQRDPLLYTRVRSIHNGQDLNQWCFVHQMVNRFNGSFRILTHDSCKQKALSEIRTYMNDQSIAVQNQLKAIYRTAPMTAQRPALTEQTPREATLFFDYSDWMNSRRKLKVNGEEQSLAARPLVFDVASQIDAIGSLGLDAYSLTDYNQDSIVDLVYSGDAETKVFLGSGDLAQSFQTSSVWQIESVSGSGGSAMVSPNFRTATHQFADVNGDSFVDVLEWKAPGQFLVFYGDGKGAYEKGAADLIIGPAIKGTTSLFKPSLADFRSGRVSLIDLNDDGRTDVLGSYRQNGVLKAVQCLASPGSTQLGCSQSNFPVQDIGDAGFNDPSLRLNDLNGDGLVDLAQFKVAQGEKGYCFYPNSGLSHQAGTQGLFGLVQGEAVCSGKGRFFAVSELSSNDSLLNFWSIDANGDGINDLVKATDGVPSASQSQLTIWMGMGDGSVTSKPRTYVLKTKLGLSQDQNSGVKFADIDADGQKEILLLKKVGTQNASVRVLDFNRIGETQLPRSNLLISIEYESGLRHDMRYATSADEYLRDQEVRDADEVTPLHFPAVVLKQLATSEGAVGGQRVDVETREYVYHRPFFDPIDRRFQGFGEVDVIEYGDGKTEQSRLTRNHYHQGSTLEQRALSGRLSLSSSYEYKPQSSSDEAGHDQLSATLDPTDAELNSMSQYARHQGELCGAPVGSGQNYERCTLRLRQIVGWETAARNADVGTLFVRRASSSEEVFDPAADARTTASCRVPTVAGASNVTRMHSLFDPELNLPTVMEEIQERLSGPFAISMPKRTVRTTYTYKDFPELGIMGLVDTRETWVSTEGDAEEKLSERLVNAYDPDSAWLASAKTEIFSSLSQVPAELEGRWQAQQEQVVSITYNDVGTVTSTDQGLGKIERLVYDEQGINLLQTINPAGETYTYTYDGKGRVRTYTTPLGLVNTLDYDELNRRRSLTTSMGYQETYSYKLGLNYQPMMIMVSKTVKRFQEDAVEPIYGLQAFNGQGQMVASFDENEQVEEGSDESVRGVRALSMRQLNRKNHVIREYVPFQTQFATIEDLFAEGFSLDGTGLSYKEFSEVNYDHFDHVVYRKEPTGTKKYIQHFAWGQAETETFRKSRESLLTETVCRVQIGRSDGIYATVDELGHVHSFDRDAKGRVTAITLAGESQSRKVKADSRGLVEMQSIPGIQTEYKVYDSLGRAVGKYVYDRDGVFQHKTEMSYDAASRPVEQKQDGSRTASYFYDRYQASDLAVLQAQSQDIVPEPKGLPTRIQKVDPNGLYDYELLIGYNTYGKPLARQISIRDRNVSGPNGLHVFVETYDYGPDGTLLLKHDPFGVSSRVRLNANLKVAGVDLTLPWNDEGWQSIIEGIRYNPKGQVNRTEYRGDIHTDLVYETDTLILKDIKSYRQGRLELQDLTLDFDGRLNVVSVKDKLSSQHWGRLNRSSDFVYNARSELVRAEWTKMKPEFGHNTVGPNVHEYGYNAAGNFLINKELSALNWSLDTATSIIPQGTADHRIQYNSMGQLTANGKVLEATYDASGKMVCARTESQIVHYGYEVSGWRYYKRVLAAVPGDSCSKAARKVAGALSLYPTESATVEPTGKQSFVMVEDMRLARVEHPAAQETEGRWYYYLKDHISSSDVMIHSDGTPVEQMAYRPYGSELDPQNSFAWKQHETQVLSKKPHERTHHRFTGNYLDDDTGLYYAVNRYYDSETGRFTTPDPLYIEKPDHCQNNTIGCSLYAYADNNPVSKIDPLGLDASNPADSAGATVDAFVSDYRSMVNDLTSHQTENLLVLTMPLIGHMVKASDCYFKSVEAFKTGHVAKGFMEAAKAAYQLSGIAKEAKGLSMATEAGAALTAETGPGAILGGGAGFVAGFTAEWVGNILMTPMVGGAVAAYEAVKSELSSPELQTAIKETLQAFKEASSLQAPTSKAQALAQQAKVAKMLKKPMAALKAYLQKNNRHAAVKK